MGKRFRRGRSGRCWTFAGATAAFTLAPAGIMLATIDYSVKLLNSGVGDQFLGRGQVISVGKSLTVSRADVFVIGEEGRHVATGLVTTRRLN